MNALDRFRPIWFDLYSRSDYRSVCEIYGLDPNAPFSGKSQEQASVDYGFLLDKVCRIPEKGGN